ncbi:MAG TPA: hypothetical protein VIF39_12680 [Hyphomicrobium sp.]
MIRVSATSPLLAAVVTAFAASAHAGRSDLLSCAGMELVQSAEPRDDAPNASPNTEPGDGSNEANSQSPDDNNDDDGAGTGSDQASPPDTAQPPGCIFQNAPLDLIV